MRLLFLILLTGLHFWGNAQPRGNIRIMFYNTENMFDTEDDPHTNDDEFTPQGYRHWTGDRYTRKLRNIYKVIVAVGGDQAPEIVGMAEVENRKVLTDLIKTTPLTKTAYQVVHYDSPDTRGIDVALLYRSDKLRLVKQQPIYVDFKNEPDKETRHILFVQFIVGKSDILYVFVNHWPSRRGGDMETAHLRIRAATILRQKADSLYRINVNPKIVIMGDFNDEPANISILTYLKAAEEQSIPAYKGLYNLSAGLKKTSRMGTYNFRGQWQMLDQIIVSTGLLSNQNGLYTRMSDIHIFSPGFLLQADKRNLGQKPFPTYSGPKYLGGFSDHLPVYLDLFLKK